MPATTLPTVPDACLPLPGLAWPGLAWPAVSEAVASYTAAVEAGAAPPPLPLYAEQQAAAAAGASSAAGGSFDVAFELLQLHAVACDPDSSGSAAAMQPLLARLLRCGCCTCCLCGETALLVSVQLATCIAGCVTLCVHSWPAIPLPTPQCSPPLPAVQALWTDTRPSRLRLLLAPAGSAVCCGRPARRHCRPA